MSAMGEVGRANGAGKVRAVAEAERRTNDHRTMLGPSLGGPEAALARVLTMRPGFLTHRPNRPDKT
jgi:hypothetical protein